ncbi:MAG: hypothetical protein AUH41_12895 [Gemmatimonadetes bacterium 13_1_40CM_66_11]|nr:MAG: hypothetical protein AUH41_12895 [Gemmatimonadetes bacterium 13_1_40CM_66_11]
MLAFVATTAASQRLSPIPVDTAAMDAHLRFLASDLLEGRAPATRGGRLAAEYIAAQFQALGLEPAGANGSYFQPVALVGMTPQPMLSWGKAGGATDTLVYRDAFVAWAERPEADIAASGEVVFVGYGIRAPEWQWDDYKGADLRGKVLLMLVNDPGLVDSTVFLGKILTYYGRWTYKLEEAARQGAAGAILIHTTESATYPWEVVRGSWSVEQFKLDQPHSPSIAFAGWVTEASARTALSKAGLNLDSLTRTAARRGFRPIPTGITASVGVHSALRRVESDNVVARLPGRDPRLASQAVLITAHWDHKGIGPPIRGDSIYNGAEDNASGVAAILGAAKALARLPRQRSVCTAAPHSTRPDRRGAESRCHKRPRGDARHGRARHGPLDAGTGFRSGRARGVAHYRVAARRAWLVFSVGPLSVCARRRPGVVDQTRRRFCRASRGMGRAAGEHLQPGPLSSAQR